MKKSIFLMAVLAWSCFGQSAANQTMPEGFKNGRYWRGLRGVHPKVMYLTGYFDGFDKAIIEFMTGQNDREIEAMAKESIPTVAMGEVMTALDRFYSAPENLNIPICRSIRIVNLKLAMRPAHDQDAEIEKARASIRYELEECNKKKIGCEHLH